MVPFDRGGLSDFTLLGEKMPPPVFVGRQDVIDDIVGIARLAWRMERKSLPANTRIVQGAPGAGKSSILAELEKRLNLEGRASGAPRILNLNSADIAGPEGVLRPLAELVNPDEAGDFLAQYQQTRNVGGDIGLPGVSLGGRLETSTIRDAPVPELQAFARWVRAGSVNQDLAGPVIIAIDEAQRFSQREDSPLARLFQGLHDGTSGLPLTLVLAGLGDTERKASEMGLTRVSNVHGIGRFGTIEVRELMPGFCRHFGISIGNCHERLLGLADPAEGWPRHLHCVQEALGHALLADGVDGHLDQIEDWETVQESSLRLRDLYYSKQSSKAMVNSQPLVGATMDSIREGAWPDEVKSTIESHLGTAHGWRLPQAMNVEQFYDHLIHQGALQERDDGTVYCPIPSFRRYLIRMGFSRPKASRPPRNSPR